MKLRLNKCAHCGKLVWFFQSRIMPLFWDEYVHSACYEAAAKAAGE